MAISPRILISPDKFKGSLSALEAAQIIERGVRAAAPEAKTSLVPLADGGEGTVQALVHATDGKVISTRATGPLGNPLDSYYGLLDNHGLRSVLSYFRTSAQSAIGVIEMSAVSGLRLVPEEKRNPLVTTTYGTGELIKTVLDAGCLRIIVGIGGSATTDGGMGMAQALGVVFLNKEGEQIGLGCGRLLSEVQHVDLNGLDERIKDIEIIIASDVKNPLCGPDGAAYVYSPQKGATPNIADELEKGLYNFAGIIKSELDLDIINTPGAGAAGGLGGGLIAFLGARLESGIDLLMKATSYSEKLKQTDLVITGEGKIDSQTAFGKVLAGVGREARKNHVPVIALGGQVSDDAKALQDIGITEIYSLMKSGMSVEESIRNAGELLEEETTKAVTIYFSKT